jgi:hypothetical protein
MAVKWADWMITRETDSYFDLTSDQNKELRQDIQKDISQVKKENFPAMAQFLRKMSSKIQSNDLSATEVSALQEEGQGIFRAAFHQFQSTAVDLSLKASPAQVEHFIKKYDKKTQQMAEEVETAQDKFKMEKKRFEKWTDEWLDGLNNDQEKYLIDHIKAHPFPWDLQLQNRVFTLNKYLEARKSEESLKTYLAHLEDQKSPEYGKALKEYQTELSHYIFDLYKSMTPEQKKYLAQQLTHRADELEKISQQKS